MLSLSKSDGIIRTFVCIHITESRIYVCIGKSVVSSPRKKSITWAHIWRISSFLLQFSRPMPMSWIRANTHVWVKRICSWAFPAKVPQSVCIMVANQLPRYRYRYFEYTDFVVHIHFGKSICFVLIGSMFTKRLMHSNADIILMFWFTFLLHFQPTTDAAHYSQIFRWSAWERSKRQSWLKRDSESEIEWYDDRMCRTASNRFEAFISMETQ